MRTCIHWHGTITKLSNLGKNAFSLDVRCFLHCDEKFLHLWWKTGSKKKNISHSKTSQTNCSEHRMICSRFLSDYLEIFSAPPRKSLDNHSKTSHRSSCFPHSFFEVVEYENYYSWIFTPMIFPSSPLQFYKSEHNNKTGKNRRIYGIIYTTLVKFESINTKQSHIINCYVCSVYFYFVFFHRKAIHKHGCDHCSNGPGKQSQKETYGGKVIVILWLRHIGNIHQCE